MDASLLGNLLISLLIREFVGDDLSFYYELKPLKAWKLACGSLETEEA